jgi:hypothetical protein
MPAAQLASEAKLTRTIDRSHFFRMLHEPVGECVPQTGATWQSPGIAP